MSVIDDVKARIDILELVQSYNVPLRKAGRLWKAPCPFHPERTPSFVVYPESGTWRCFGACAEGGDAFQFVMKQENTDFKGALETLARRTGVELKPQTNEQKERDVYLDKLRGLLSETAEFFYVQLLESENASHARAYVKKRGLKRGTVDSFRIGFAPDDWRAALTHLETLGYSEDDVITAGVATRNEKGNVYDRFRNRLVIPIRDPRGQVIGFGARALDPEDTPKYLNSSQTPLFDKGHTLFGFDVARRTIRETETAVIVEGYMDALQAHQAGFPNVVAQMGTALTDVQLKLLVKYAKKLIIALDPDEAGMNATLRSLSVARSALGKADAQFDPTGTLRQSNRMDVDIRVMMLPEGQDPDDLLRDEPEKWEALVNGAQPIIDYVIESGTARVTPGMAQADREKIARELLPILLESGAHRHYSIQKLALRLRINERDLLSLAQTAETNQKAIPATAKQQERAARLAGKSAPASQNAPTSPLTAQRNQTAPSLLQRAEIDLEGYCLAALLKQPELLSLANRKLAELNQARDPQLGGLLGPLGLEDFERSEYRAALSLFSDGLEQVEIEPLEYLYTKAPADLAEQLDRLLKGPLARMQEAGGWVTPELASIGKDKLRFGREKKRASNEFIETVLMLRQRRIKRLSAELGFLHQDQEPPDPDAPPQGSPESTQHAQLTLTQQVHRQRVATRQIDLAIRALRQAR